MGGKVDSTGNVIGKSLTGISFPSARVYLNRRKLFTPASNTKLYTSWFACKSLGEDATFHSEYSVVDGRLYFRPLGNPLLDESSMAEVVEYCEDMKIREIILETGHIRAPRYPGSWNFDDMGHAWGAPISDVCFHENAIAATFDCLDAPPSKTMPASSIHSFIFSQSVSEPQIHERKIVLPAGFKGNFSFSILEPEDFLLHWISDNLGSSRSRRKLRIGRFRGEPQIVCSRTLAQVLHRLNKVSSNVIAELLLLHAARPSGRDASTAEASELMRMSLAASGISDAWLFDGSGLTRGNLVSPAGTVKLLRMIANLPSVVSSLPVGGTDGTLKERKLSRAIRAKTGSLGGVQTLSGFAGNEPFSVMVNHFPESEDADGFVKDWIDGLIMSLVR
ncbi:MAG: D-alanyl-D-alanine carboxypeptidase [Thermoplasmata archaeon]|nr:D-alanyl-D-alanine carboxypeptidase [Candidatus Sysuiplasma acidicola]MBX8646795.1 D-alanyl-D-alanine carboxypeptidase [Candidatus Sysuiplasma acidicola]